VERRFRLTRSTDFQRVRRNGKSYAHPLMVLVTIPSDIPGPAGIPSQDQPGQSGLRCGVTAGRSVGGAVQRNRAKRRLRNAIHPLLPGLKSGWDIVLIARQPLLEADFVQVQAALSVLLRRANLLEGSS
jgi:ribonuclease P protein component